MMQGPATQALERSFKRIKVDPQQQCSASYLETAFDFNDTFDQVSAVGASSLSSSSHDQYYESFPSIGFNFYDDSDDDDNHYTSNGLRSSSSFQTPIQPAVELSTTTSSSSEGKKRNRSGMLRSKTFSQNLCELDETINESSSLSYELSAATQQQQEQVQHQSSAGAVVVEDTSGCKQTSMESILKEYNTFVLDNSNIANSSSCKVSLMNKKNSFATMTRLSSRASLFTSSTLNGSRRLQTIATLAC